MFLLITLNDISTHEIICRLSPLLFFFNTVICFVVFVFSFSSTVRSTKKTARVSEGETARARGNEKITKKSEQRRREDEKGKGEKDSKRNNTEKERERGGEEGRGRRGSGGKEGGGEREGRVRENS